jgi:membrane glycosyltransferase
VDGVTAPPTPPRGPRIWLRRLLLLVLVAGSIVPSSWLMATVLEGDGLTWLDIAVVSLFTINFAWIVISFWTAVIGFLRRLADRGPASLDTAADPLTTRTAIVMPIYNEDTVRVFAGLEATWRSVMAAGEAHAFDLFVLSDTRRPEIAQAEEAAWAALVRRLGGEGRIFYRRRERNEGRKAGNIADFCAQWGGAYDFMLVLDADSVMTGATALRLARLMQRHGDAGIIQTVPVPVNRDTAFARMIQFASRIYSPLLALGMSWWQRGDGNYWGHNAIIRISAFAESCGLPILPGKPPLGGEILSHDFVEAALIRRAGWSVWTVPDVEGSWEEVPANTLDYANRDRRWCQGNLQHLKLLRMPGLRAMSRLHLMMGVMGYVASPLWLLLLLLSTADAFLIELVGPSYFLPGRNLFPTWPVSRDWEIGILLWITVTVLFGPRIMSLLVALARPADRQAFGGSRRLIVSAVVELFGSMLTAPMMMLFHTRFVVSTLLGHVVVWDSQPRDDRGITFGEAVSRHWFHVLLGLAWAASVLWISPDFFWWLLPIFLGLVLSLPSSWLLSRADLGRWCRRRGLFLIPEETRPPVELQLLADRERTGLPAAPETDRPLPRVPERRPRPVVGHHSEGGTAVAVAV